MKTTLAIVMLAVTSALSNAAEISNAFMGISCDQNLIKITCKTDPDLEVPRIVLPGEITSVKTSEVKDSLWGGGQQLELLHESGQRRTTLRLFKDQPFAHLATTLINVTDKPLELVKTDIGEVYLRVGTSLDNLRTLGSGGLRYVDQPTGSFTYFALADRVSTKGVMVGWLSQLQGVGTFQPSSVQQGAVCIVKAGLQFGNYRIAPKAERGTDTMVIGFTHDVRSGLETFGDTLAKAYKIKLPPKPEVYCTWYHRNLSGSGASNEKMLAENASFAREHLAPFGLNVMQIDDEWQDAMGVGNLGVGPIKVFEKANDRFPGGMQKTAENLKSAGFIPGIWFMPFAADPRHPIFDKAIFAKDAATGAPYDSLRWSGATIDATAPTGEAFLSKRFQTIYNWGYRYYKVDGLHIGAPSENVYVDREFKGGDVFAKATIANPDMTFVQGFRHGLGILQKEAPGVFILGCTITQNMFSMGASFGKVHAMRVGPDNDKATEGHWGDVTTGAHFSGNLYFLNNRVWYNDPDPYYERPSNPLNMARWMISWQAVSGAMGTSSMQYATLPAERLDLLKRALPTHRLKAYPVDLLDHALPRVWTVANERMRIVGLFNSSEKDAMPVASPLAKMGLDANQEFDAFEFWSNRYLGRVKGTLERTLEPASCEVIALRPVSTHPQVLSTSRHITQGLMDVVSERWDPATRILSGTSEVVAGDRYELRVVLPEGASVQKTLFDGVPLELKQEGSLLRASSEPKKTGVVKWHLLIK